MPKSQEVEKLFTKISSHYDFMNDVISLGQHRLWKRALVQRALLRSEDECLDLCTGTGDIALALAQKAKKVVAVDFCEAMLEKAKMRSEKKAGITFQKADIQDLPFKDESFDLVTISYGLRNIENPSKALEEIYRVLKPEGRFLCLEATEVKYPFVSQLARLYTHKIIPLYAKIFKFNVEAYAYLPKSIQIFWTREKLKCELEKVGFKKCHNSLFLFGVATLTFARKSFRI